MKTPSTTTRSSYQWRLVSGLFVGLLLIGGIVYFAWPNAHSTNKSNQLQVVAAENFWGNIASQLGGRYVHVTSIITDPNADPHLYESSAQDAAAVTAAKVAIVNGLGYDDFMSKLLNASSSHDRTVITASQILDAPEGANQHLWYNIAKVPDMANTITQAYIAKDPTHAATYRQNLAAFDASLQPIQTLITQVRSQFAGVPVAYTEPVPGYLLQAAGLSVQTPEGFAKSIEDGDDPSPADTEAMDNLMTNKAVKVLFYNAQATSPATEHVKDLARQAGIPVIGVTETLPAHEKNYQSWQYNQLQALLAALKG